MPTNQAVEAKLAAEFAPPRFAIRNLSVLAYAQGFTLWHYRPMGGVQLSVVAAPGFFNDAADMFASGDMMLVSGTCGAAVLFVTSTDGGVRTGFLSGNSLPASMAGE